MFLVKSRLIKVYVGMKVETRPNTCLGDEEIIAEVHYQIFQI